MSVLLRMLLLVVMRCGRWFNTAIVRVKIMFLLDWVIIIIIIGSDASIFIVTMVVIINVITI